MTDLLASVQHALGLTLRPIVLWHPADEDMQEIMQQRVIRSLTDPPPLVTVGTGRGSYEAHHVFYEVEPGWYAHLVRDTKLQRWLDWYSPCFIDAQGRPFLLDVLAKKNAEMYLVRVGHTALEIPHDPNPPYASLRAPPKDEDYFSDEQDDEDYFSDEPDDDPYFY